MTQEKIAQMVVAEVERHLSDIGLEDKLEQIKEMMITLDVVLEIIQNDPHQWSERPCQTCRGVSSLVGKPFGCDKYRIQREQMRQKGLI